MRGRSVSFHLLPRSPIVVGVAASLLWLSSCDGQETSPPEPSPARPDPAPENAPAQDSDAPEWHRTASGLQYAVVEQGDSDEHPAVDDLVLSRFHFRLPGGQPLRHLASPGTTKMRVGAWIDAWNEGVQLMTPGSHYRFRAPPALAKAQGAGIAGVPPDSPLLFEVELVSIERMPRFERIDPEHALTLGGERMRYVWEAEGSGDPPTREDRVVMHYTRWDMQGHMLESSRWVDEPLDVLLSELQIPVLRRAAMLMPKDAVMRLEAPTSMALPPNQRAKAPEGHSQWLLEMQEILPPLPPPEFVRPNADDLQTTGSGLQYQIVEPGSGDPPGPTNRVRLHYAAWLEDGTLFDDSYSKAKPAELTVESMIPGWREALQLMRPGAVFRVVLPPKLAYGAKGVEGKVPADATLIFHMHLIEVLPPAPDPFAALRSRLAPPPEFALPSGDVQTTESGVRYQVVEPGEPAGSGRAVRVRYVAWLADGTEVESTWESSGVPPAELPAGAREAAHHIGVGGQVRAVVPPEAAYGEQGKPPLIGPSATLVYAIDMLDANGAANRRNAPPAGGEPKRRPAGGKPKKTPQAPK